MAKVGQRILWIAGLVPAGGLIAGLILIKGSATTPEKKAVTALEAAGPPVRSVFRLDAPPRKTPAPDFQLPGLQGNTVRLKDLRGKAVFLNFWATWCPPCRREMPSMETLYREFKGPDFEMLAVSIDAKGKEVVAPYVQEMGLTFPILLDIDSKVIQEFGARGLPTTYLIDPEGNIAAAAVGPREWSSPEAREAIRTLIEKGSLQ